jgi:hypothetical protein
MVQHHFLTGRGREALPLMIHGRLNSEQVVKHLVLAGHEREALTLVLHDRLNSDQIVLRGMLNKRPGGAASRPGRARARGVHPDDP